MTEISILDWPWGGVRDRCEALESITVPLGGTRYLHGPEAVGLQQVNT